MQVQVWAVIMSACCEQGTDSSCSRVEGSTGIIPRQCRCNTQADGLSGRLGPAYLQHPNSLGYCAEGQLGPAYLQNCTSLCKEQEENDWPLAVRSCLHTWLWQLQPSRDSSQSHARAPGTYSSCIPSGFLWTQGWQEPRACPPSIALGAHAQVHRTGGMQRIWGAILRRGAALGAAPCRSA